MDTKTDLGFQELSADELFDVTGACRPHWELSAASVGGKTVVTAHEGDKEFKLIANGPVTFEESSWKTGGRAVSWTLDPGMHASLTMHSFDMAWFRA